MQRLDEIEDAEHDLSSDDKIFRAQRRFYAHLLMSAIRDASSLGHPNAAKMFQPGVVTPDEELEEERELLVQWIFGEQLEDLAWLFNLDLAMVRNGLLDLLDGLGEAPNVD